MPQFTGVSHVSLSVVDREASCAWYRRVLGFEPFEEAHEPEYDEWIMLQPQARVILCLQQHKANRGERFDPRRTGGDHVGFKVDRREDLDGWTSWFQEQGVEHSPVVDAPYGSVLCFKDRDGFQLEMFHRPNHP